MTSKTTDNMERLTARRRGAATMLRDATGKILIVFDDVMRPNRVAWTLEEAEAAVDAELGGEVSR